MYEREIRECGFNGAQPYWDWTIDAISRDALFKSPVFDSEFGFGGNGPWVPGTIEDPEPGVEVTGIDIPFDMSNRTGGGCVADGPFANMTIHMGPGNNVSYNPRCIRRDFIPDLFFEMASQEVVNRNMAIESFPLFQQSSGSLHIAGHPGIGGIYGTLTDVYGSRKSILTI